jgi:hypothetical protein
MMPSLTSRLRGHRWVVASLACLAPSGLASFAPAPASGQAPPPPPLALFNVTLIDGTGGPPQRGVHVLIQDGLVRSVFRTGEIMLSANIEAFDFSGHYLIPGLVNTHVHFLQLGEDTGGTRLFDRAAVLAELERSLYSGVTAVREMAGNAPATAELVRTTRAELRPLPDVHFSLVTAGAGFFASDPRVAGPREQAGPDRLPPGAVTPETDPAQLVGFAKELGARGIKIYSDLDAARVRALTDEAHRQGLRAWAHATVFPTRPDEVVGAGVDGISHVCGLPWEVLPDVPERFSERPRFDPTQVDPSDARFTALFQEMWRRGTVLDATLFLYTNEATWQRGCIPDLMIPLARAAHREGVPISTGTDFFNDLAPQRDRVPRAERRPHPRPGDHRGDAERRPRARHRRDPRDPRARQGRGPRDPPRRPHDRHRGAQDRGGGGEGGPAPAEGRLRGSRPVRGLLPAGDPVTLSPAPAAPARPARAGSALTRASFLANTALMSAIVLWGFWPFYAGLFGGGIGRHPVIYVHATVFTGWMALLATQALLVYRREVGRHRSLGAFGVVWGAAVLLLGLVVTFVAPAQHVLGGEMTLDDAAGFLILPLGDLALFGGFFGAAVAWRRAPQTHKRLILLATLALLYAPAARAGGRFGLLAVLGIWLVPLVMAMGVDLVDRGRVHRVYWIGGGILVVAFCRIFLMGWEPWLVIGRGLLGPFLR